MLILNDLQKFIFTGYSKNNKNIIKALNNLILPNFCAWINLN